MMAGRVGKAAFSLMALLAIVLVVATVVEKFCGTPFINDYVYSSPLFVGLWAVLLLVALAYIVMRRAWLRSAALWLHLSFAVVLVGAFITYLTAERGTLYICKDAPPASMFVTSDGSLVKFPFGITLQSCRVDVYDDTDVPRDYVAELSVESPRAAAESVTISMNNVYDREGCRFCVSDVSGECVTLLVRHDVYGVPVTYVGYIMLLLSVVALLAGKQGLWGALLRRLREGVSSFTGNKGGFFRGAIMLVSLIAFGFVSYEGVSRWVGAGVFPVSSGSDALVFAAWCVQLLALVFFRRLRCGSLFLCLLLFVVAVLCSGTSQGYVMPVLRTPLLFFHVSVIIISYVLIAFMALNASVALCYYWFKGDVKRMERMALLGRVVLYPATMLLTVGIFIGAVWADISWGRYWGWDPKEVWALVTLILCSFGFHTRSLRFMNNSLAFHLFCVVAFFSMLFTFFGVNYLLGGLHSYA